MATDLATHAAAVTAGYTSTATDRGASALAAERWHVRLEKRLTGAGHSGEMHRADGYGSSQANAEAQALAALNGQRKIRYGAGTPNSTGSRGGGALTSDVD